MGRRAAYLDLASCEKAPASDCRGPCTPDPCEAAKLHSSLRWMRGSNGILTGAGAFVLGRCPLNPVHVI